MAQPPQSLTQAQFIQAVDHVINERKTIKVLRAVDECADFSDAQQQAMRDILQAILPVAGMAPFHRVAHKTHTQGALSSPVPWRFYVLEKPACCAVLRHIQTQAATQPDSAWARALESKVPKLLAGAGALVLVTWLPDPSENGGQPALSENNVEHIAAASAAVQNLLLAAEARGLYTYWATGGILKEAFMLAHLGIAPSERLLGAIYLAPQDMPHEALEGGALRDKRGDLNTWCRWLEL